MANRIFLLCLFLVCLFINLNLTECKGGRGGGGHSHSSGGRSHSSGGHSWGRSWGSSSGSHSWSSSSGSSYKPSSSWSGSSWGSHSYPSSSGLSGSSGSSWGSSSGSHSYPSSTGLSGSGSSGSSWSSIWGSSSSGSHSYPSSSGLSGSGSSGSSSGRHSYPSSTGLSGSGSSGSSSGRHSYPSSTGLSGSGTFSSSYGSGNKYTYGTSYYPSHSYNTNSQPNHISGYHYIPKTYYSSPQYVYVTEYRNSGSRYNDLLTGLTLYNLGRSHSHHHDHYYYDDYYRQRHYGSSSNSYGVSNKPQTVATCTLKIKENNKVEVLKIPCEIVSTFTEGSSKQSVSTASQNKTVCVTNTTVTNKTVPVNASSVKSNMSNFIMTPNGTLVPLIAGIQNETLGNSTVYTNGTMQSSVTTNITSCTSAVNATDPLKVKGPPVNTSDMECTVEIHTNEALLTYNVSCNTLVEYSKMKEQKSTIMPSREKLETWLNKPPWWLSMFIAL